MKKTTPKSKAPAARSQPKSPVKKLTAGKPAAKKAAGEKTSATADGARGERWNLRLYVAGQTPKSLTAFANLKKLCEEHLAGRYTIEVCDLTKQPHLAINDQIVALPTLVRKLPEPIKRIVGDLSNTERVVVGMELQTIGH